MMLAPLPQLPNGRGHLKVDLPYVGPALADVKLGSIPNDYHSDDGDIKNPYTACDGGACSIADGHDVVVAQPTFNGDGSVKMQNSVAHIDVRTASVAGAAVRWGLIGAAVGVAAGLVGSFLGGGAPAAPIAVGVVVGAVAAAVGADQAAGDKVRLEWREDPIEEKRLAGYTHTATEHTWVQYIWAGKVMIPITHHDGYDHQFAPDVQARQLGTYWHPVAVHERT